MLIDYRYITNKYGNPRGIIHLGAHLAEELDVYLQNGQNKVVWVEANPNLFEDLKDVLKNTSHLVFNQLLSDKDGERMKFNIAKNYYNENYQSSSVLDFGTHETDHPHIKMESSIILESKTISTLFSENNLNFDDYDFVNLDLQGYELPVIKGFGQNLSKMKYIYVEVNTGEVYINCSKLDEVDDYLGKYGFERVEISMTDANWGDALYIKKN
jgi:FkbM family methyltransferase